MSELFLPQYAAQAVISLEAQGRAAPDGDFRSMVRALASTIRSAVCVCLPEHGEIYRDNVGGGSMPSPDECESFIGLPAPITCFEYSYPDPGLRAAYESYDTNFPTKRITIALDGKQLEMPGYVSLISLSYMPEHAHWMAHQAVLCLASPLVVVPMPQGPLYWGAMLSMVHVATRQPIAIGSADSERLFGQMKPDLGAVVQCCHALRAGAFLREAHEPSAMRRWKFAKKGAGGFTYHILTLPERAGTLGPHGGGSHSSPRLHVRRAHIRKLPTGCLTFVRQCFVGDREKGEVKKHYRLKGPGHGR